MRLKSKGTLLRAGLLFVPALVLALVWKLTPLGEFLSSERWSALLEAAQGAWWGPWAVIIGMVVGGLLMVPLGFFLAPVGALFPWPYNWLVAASGTFLNATVLYWIGRTFGQRTVSQLVPKDLLQALEESQGAGVLTLAGIRYLPIAHFSLVNAGLGALGYSFRRYMLSTLVGMTPIVTLHVLLGDRLSALLKTPSVRGGLALFGVILGFIFYMLYRRHARLRARAKGDGAELVQD